MGEASVRAGGCWNPTSIVSGAIDAHYVTSGSRSSCLFCLLANISKTALRALRDLDKGRPEGFIGLMLKVLAKSVRPVISDVSTDHLVRPDGPFPGDRVHAHCACGFSVDAVEVDAGGGDVGVTEDLFDGLDVGCPGGEEQGSLLCVGVRGV